MDPLAFYCIERERDLRTCDGVTRASLPNNVKIVSSWPMN